MNDRGFNKQGFMEYLQSEYNGLENFMFRATVENIITYGLLHQHNSKDMFCYFVSDLIEEVEFREVAAFMNDEYLTHFGKLSKYNFLDECK